MIKFKLYRRVRWFLGSRSFVKQSPDGTTYALLKGVGSSKVSGILIESGFVEEWSD